MSLRSWGPGKEVSDPRGMWSRTAYRRKSTPARASWMQNMRVAPGVVRSRPGTLFVETAADHVTGLYNWITPENDNLVLYQDGDDIRSWDQATSVRTIIYIGTTTTNTVRPSFADFDVWLYFCGYDVNGDGTFACQIFGGIDSSGNPVVDQAFRGPVVISSGTAVDAGPGLCTIGTHNFGVIYKNRTGYSGAPTTTPAISVTLSADMREIDVSVTIPAQPDGGLSVNGGIQATLTLIMTRADNPNLWYFIPAIEGTGTTVVQNVAWGDPTDPTTYPPVTYSFVVNISDEDLAASGTPATDYFDLVTQDQYGNPPFLPSFVVAYGQRMVYGAGTSLLVSDPNNPQQIAYDRNTVTMPNQRKNAYAFQLPGSTDLYATGEFWTSRIVSNSDSPSTWPEPVQVSDLLGAKSPNLVCAKTGGNYVWIVTSAGPYLFTGVYGDKPLTYMCSDVWDRVNWNASEVIECADDVTNLHFYIAVPLDGASQCTHLICIDYTYGTDFNSVDISLDNIGSRPTFGSIGLVRETATGKPNLWIAPYTPFTGILRLNIPVAYDGTTSIWDADGPGGAATTVAATWKSGLIRGAQDFGSKMIRIGGADLWLRGQGTEGGIWQIWRNLDEKVYRAPPLMDINGHTVLLTPYPGIEYMCKFDLAHIENYTVEISVHNPGDWVEISMIRTYAKPDWYNR